MAVNCLDPKQLSDYIVLSTTVQLAGTGVAGAAPYKALTLTGTLPVPGTTEAGGVVTDVRNSFATVALQGIVICTVKPSEVIPLGAPVAFDANGLAVVNGGALVTRGRALDSTTASAVTKYIRVQLTQG